jgi:hypothetical protein
LLAGDVPRSTRLEAAYTGAVSSRDITEELVEQVVADLHARYSLDDDDVRVLGAILADPTRGGRQTENVAFAERFVAEHQATFDRLSR